MQMNLKGKLFLIPFFLPSPLLNFLFGTVQEQTFEYHLWLNSPIGGALYWLKKYTRFWEVACVNVSPPVSSDFTLYNLASSLNLGNTGTLTMAYLKGYAAAAEWPQCLPWPYQILHLLLNKVQVLSFNHPVSHLQVERLGQQKHLFSMIWYLIVGSDSLLILLIWC